MHVSEEVAARSGVTSIAHTRECGSKHGASRHCKVGTRRAQNCAFDHGAGAQATGEHASQNTHRRNQAEQLASGGRRTHVQRRERVRLLHCHCHVERLAVAACVRKNRRMIPEPTQPASHQNQSIGKHRTQRRITEAEQTQKQERRWDRAAFLPNERQRGLVAHKLGRHKVRCVREQPLHQPARAGKYNRGRGRGQQPSLANTTQHALPRPQAQE